MTVLKFSLSWLFAVTAVVAVSFGWPLGRIQERREALRWIEHQGGFVNAYEAELIDPLNCEPPRYWAAVSMPRIRLWLGDQPVHYINIVRTSAKWEDRERLSRLFPEAFVVPERPDDFRPRAHLDQ